MGTSWTWRQRWELGDRPRWLRPLLLVVVILSAEVALSMAAPHMFPRLVWLSEPEDPGWVETGCPGRYVEYERGTLFWDVRTEVWDHGPDCPFGAL